MSREAALRDLLISLFSAHELRDWLGGGSCPPELLHGLPAETAPASVVAGEVVTALLRRGLVNPALFGALLTERPSRRDDIARVATDWGIDLLATNDARVDNPPEPEPLPPKGRLYPLEQGPFVGPLFETRRRLPQRGLRIAARIAGDRVSCAASGWRDDRPRLTWTRSLSELDSALRAARCPRREDLRGAEALAHHAAAGRVLYAWLFGDRTRELCVLGFGSPESDVPTLGALRLRLTLPPELQGLPWRALRVHDTPLLDCGWTVEEGPDRIPERGLILQNPPRMVLMVIPTRDEEALTSRWHERALRRRIDTLWPAPGVPTVEVARTLDDLRAALRRRPELVYVYAQAELDEGEAWLRLGRGVHPQDLRLDELLAQTAGAVVVLNLLGPDAPIPPPTGADPPAALLLGPPDAGPVEALTWAERWWDQCFGGARDPLLAALHLGEAGRAGAGVRAWGACDLGETLPHVGRDRQGKAAQALDRVAARGEAWLKIHDFLGGARRVLCLLGRGPPGEEVGQLGGILARHLRPQVEAHGGAWTPRDDPRRRPLPLESPVRIRAALEARLPDAADLSARLERLATEALGRTRARPLLWLDCGTRAAPRDDEIGLWIAFAHEVLAPHCPDGLQIVWFLAVEAEDYEAIGELVEPPERGATDLVFEAPLPPVGLVPREDLRLFLNDANHCSAATELSLPQRRQALDALMHRTGGRWQALVDEIDQAEKLGWHELLLHAATLPDRTRGR